MDVAGFSSALLFTKVRDFAYHDRHPLHYGVRSPEVEPSFEASDRGVGEEVQVSGSHSEQMLENDAHLDEEGENGSGLPAKRSSDDIYRRAVALFDFEPENSNEAPLVEGQVVWISYRHGQGWLVAENLETGETGLVPEEYVQVLPESDEEWVDAN